MVELPSVEVHNLSKRFRIGQREEIYTNLSERVLSWARSPLTNLRRLRGLSRFVEGEKGNDVLWALRDVSFQMTEGEVLGVIGHNGAGKSTLLKVLSRISEPTSGRAVIRGRVSSLLEVGTGFHPELTGRENVYLNGTILGMKRREIDTRLDQIVEFSGVERFIDTPVKRFSTGMKVRLAFSVAAHLEPEVLFIDEVLAVGDAAFQRRCLGRLESLGSSGRTIIFVSHDLAMIEALCSRALLLERGLLKAEGLPADVIAEYLSSGSPLASSEVDPDSPSTSMPGPVRIVRWQLEDLRSPGQAPRSGGDCKVTLHYEGAEEQSAGPFTFAITIKDLLGRPLASASTHLVGGDYPSLGREGSIVCEIRGLPLAPGMYRLHLWCGVQGVVSCVIRDAGVVEIVSTDPFGTGRQPRPAVHGPVLLLGQRWLL